MLEASGDISSLCFSRLAFQPQVPAIQVVIMGQKEVSQIQQWREAFSSPHRVPIECLSVYSSMLAKRHFRFGFQINSWSLSFRNWHCFVQSRLMDPAGLAGQKEKVWFPSKLEHYSGQSRRHLWQCANLDLCKYLRLECHWSLHAWNVNKAWGKWSSDTGEWLERDIFQHYVWKWWVLGGYS